MTAAEREVERDVQPAGRSDPEHAEQDAEERARPHEDQQQHALFRREREHGDRRVRAGDQQQDVGVVDALEHSLRLRAPIEAVVQRRIAEEKEGGGHEHGRGPLRRRPLGEDDQDDSGDDRDGECRGMDPPAPRGLQVELLVGGGGFEEGELGHLRARIFAALVVHLSAVVGCGSGHDPSLRPDACRDTHTLTRSPR